MSTLPNPLLANYLASANPAPPALGTGIAMPGSAPSMGSPVLPNVSLAPPPPPTQTQRDMTERDRLINTGDGISQINNPLLRGIARAADIAGSVFTPGLAAAIPGTMLHHNILVHQATRNVAADQAEEQATAQTAGTQAKTAQDQATTAYETQKPILEQNKIDATKLANHAKYAQLAAKAGQIMTVDPATNEPSFEDDPNSQAYKDRVALAEMHNATAAKDAITSEIAQNKYKPGTPEYADAQRRLDQVDKRLGVAVGGLGLRAESLDLRRQNTNASLHGTDNAGAPLPGAAQITGDNGEQTTVGSKFAPTAIKANSKTVTFNDLTGSVSHLRNAIKAYEAEGGDMSDPRLAAAAADTHSTVGKVIQGKLVTGGLSPSAITLLNAQRQTEEQAGILRSTTGGTSSEAGAQRILAVVPHFGSDTNQSAYSKLDEQENVLGRLAPGQTHVQGGVSVSRPGGTPKAKADPLGIR